jgi:hypothetical protein
MEMPMRAIEAETFSGYGGLRQIELPKPQSAKDRVLVRVTAAGVTPRHRWCSLFVALATVASCLTRDEDHVQCLSVRMP